MGLNDWDISRDAPYFGIEIPDAPGKYFYVWLDAPVGYLASLKNYFGKKNIDYDAFFADPQVQQVHFIGKDITYFHTLFWPAMLHFSGRKTPDHVFVHGFITLGGDFDSFMADPAVEQIHFIGKDIVTFHTLFWPAMLHFSGRKVPDHIYVHGDRKSVV